MNEREIKILAEEGSFEGKPLQGKLEETHISWVILSEEHAYKIKKPIALSFLDFSSLELRKKFCEMEVQLNSRYTDIYLSVLPIRFFDQEWIIGNGEGKIVDYAVHMKRMDSEKKMDVLLKLDKVKVSDLKGLAEVVSGFHQNAAIIQEVFDLESAKKLFNNLGEHDEFLKQFLEENISQIITESIEWSNTFLEKHKGRFQERLNAGYRRDVHGDLHSGNIFLCNPPVLFDCIEFNDVFRQIDLLYEVAFLCMDLDAYGRSDLSQLFLTEYNSILKVIAKAEDQDIFLYFKCLRANVRAKIHSVSFRQSPDNAAMNDHLIKTKKYLLLMRDYIKEMKK